MTKYTTLLGDFASLPEFDFSVLLCSFKPAYANCQVYL